MRKLKNVGAGPVSAQKEVIDNCPEFSKRSKQKNIRCSSVHSNFNGITLIALIITIIVMLILVGVTINVALNGGLFESATTAATETKKEAEKEQLLSAVVGAIGTDGKVDSTKISLPEGFAKDEGKSTASKLVVKGKEIVWQINLNSGGIEPYSGSNTGATTYTFTIKDLAERGILDKLCTESGCSKDEFFPEGISEELKNSTKSRVIQDESRETYNITCADSRCTNSFDKEDPSPEKYDYTMILVNDSILFALFDETGHAPVNSQNYTAYEDISFTISMW